MMLLNLSELQQPCECKMSHHLTIKKILNEREAIASLASFLNEEGLSDPVLICDTNTKQLLGKALLNQLPHVQVIVLNADRLHADEEGLSQLATQLPKKTAVLLAFGSGTIHDLTRYTANELEVPFISIPTAPSVDGFASNVAAMTFNGFKVTTTASAPLAIFADPDIYANAPQFLTSSGIGDLLGKYTAILDWKVGHLLTSEPICQKVIGLTQQALDLVVKSIDQQDEELPIHLMNGLILSGIAMQMVGSSRPASGAEHHLSHLWEMHVINEELEALHGEKVGVGLLLVLKVYTSLLRHDTMPPLKRVLPFCENETYRDIFDVLYEDLLKENKSDPLEHISKKTLQKQFKNIQGLVAELPTVEKVQALMVASNCKISLEDLKLSDAIKNQSLELAPYIRQRLTLLKLMKLFDC